MDQFMSKSVARGKMTEEQKQETLGRIKTTTNLELMADVDVVIEAVIENMELKKNIFAELDRIVPRRSDSGNEYVLDVNN